jgi:hypothetical protein
VSKIDQITDSPLMSIAAMEQAREALSHAIEVNRTVRGMLAALVGNLPAPTPAVAAKPTAEVVQKAVKRNRTVEQSVLGMVRRMPKHWLTVEEMTGRTPYSRRHVKVLANIARDMGWLEEGRRTNPGGTYYRVTDKGRVAAAEVPRD